MKLWHIEVEREISDDNFNFHIRSKVKPTDEQILKEAEEKHYWQPKGEEYRLKVSEVTI